MTVHKISGAFFKDMEVEWPCPGCGQKNLQIIKESFTLKDTQKTTRNINDGKMGVRIQQ